MPFLLIVSYHLLCKKASGFSIVVFTRDQNVLRLIHVVVCNIFTHRKSIYKDKCLLLYLQFGDCWPTGQACTFRSTFNCWAMSSCSDLATDSGRTTPQPPPLCGVWVQWRGGRGRADGSGGSENLQPA